MCIEKLVKICYDYYARISTTHLQRNYTLLYISLTLGRNCGIKSLEFLTKLCFLKKTVYPDLLPLISFLLALIDRFCEIKIGTFLGFVGGGKLYIIIF